MPRFHVNCKCTGSFVAALIHVSGSVVEDTQHWDDTIRGTIGASNVGSGGSDAVDVQSDATGRLGDHGASFESVVDSLDRVAFHGDEKAG